MDSAPQVVQRDHAHEGDLVDLKRKVHKLFQVKSEEHRTALKAAADQYEAEKVDAQNEVHRLFQRQEEEHLAEKGVWVRCLSKHGWPRPLKTTTPRQLPGGFETIYYNFTTLLQSVRGGNASGRAWGQFTNPQKKWACITFLK